MLLVDEHGLVDRASIPNDASAYEPGCLRIATDAATGAPVQIPWQYVILYMEAIVNSKATYDATDGVWEGICKGGVPSLARPLARPTCIKNMTPFELHNGGADVDEDGVQRVTKNEFGCGPYSTRPYMFRTLEWKLTCLTGFFVDAQVGARARAR